MSKNLLDRLGYFDGVTFEDALAHAVPLEGPISLPGVPVGISDDSAKSPVGSDFTLKRRLDSRLTTKSIGIIGDQGIGKTFLLNVLLYIWSAEAKGRHALGIQIDSLKHNNNNRPETDPLVKDLLGCTVIQVGKIHLNPLNPLWGFTFDEQYSMVRTMLEVWWEGKLTANQEHLLDHYLRLSYSNTTRPNFTRLADSIAAYRAEEGFTPEQAVSMEASALELSNMVRVFTRGDLGKVFDDDANDEELLKLIEQFAKSWDFHGVKPKERSIIEVFRGTVEQSALQLKDASHPELGSRHPERVAQYIGRDEAYDAWKNPVFAESEFLRMKTLRELDVTLAMCWHRLVDFTSSVGTDIARNILREISVWYIGRQSKADLPDLKSFLGLPNHVLQTLPTLPKGHFWEILPGDPEPRLFTVIGTPLEIQHFVTNQANEALLQRYIESLDKSFYFEWLEKTSPPIPEEAQDPPHPNTPADWDSDDLTHDESDPSNAPGQKHDA